MSVFLSIPEVQWVASNAHAFAIRDGFPVSPGHTLVITRRVVPDWFAASTEERAAIFDLVDVVKRQLDGELHPDGYNVGLNAGAAAGQTVMHLHVHVIPRYRGDVDDPRGGVRHVIPGKGNYLRAEPLATGGESDPFARHVLPLFDTAREIAILAAFVQESGLIVIAPHVRSALRRGARLRILTGDYLDITQASALEMLLDWQEATHVDGEGEPEQRLEARVIETEQIRRAFHPKAWRFESERGGVAFVGSSNLSHSALMSGIEWNLRVDRERDAHAYARIAEGFEKLWSLGRVLDVDWVDRYAERARRERRSLPPGENDAEALEPAPRRTRCSSRRSPSYGRSAPRAGVAPSSSSRPASARPCWPRSTTASSPRSSGGDRASSSSPTGRSFSFRPRRPTGACSAPRASTRASVGSWATRAISPPISSSRPSPSSVARSTPRSSPRRRSITSWSTRFIMRRRIRIGASSRRSIRAFSSA